MTIRGALNAPALAQAMTLIVSRHEALRTRFVLHSSLPHQLIDPPAEVPMPLIDLSGELQARAMAELGRQREIESTSEFNVARGPLLRLKLLKLAAHEHILFLKIHHLICDGWSLAILLRELRVIYEALARGETRCPLPPLSLQYADYSIWQHGWLNGEVFAHEMKYWQRQFDGLPELLLSTDRPRPQEGCVLVARYPIAIPADLSSALRRLAHGQGSTLYHVLVASLQLLLYRLSNQTEVAIASPVAGRIHRATEDLIGFFLNVLLIRARVSEEESFKALLSQCRKTALEAQEHQCVPLEKLMLKLAPGRALYRVQLIFQNGPRIGAELAGLEVELSIGERQLMRCDLTVEMHEARAGLTGCVIYAAQLFDEASIARLWHQWIELLKAIVAAPDRRLAAL